MLENAPARIERDLIVKILRGEFPPGSHLPTVRELAANYAVTVATAHRATARLEKTGLVSVRQGSGIRVNSPETHGDLSLLPAWIEALADAPERVVSMVADFLEIRRTLAARLIVRHRDKVAAAQTVLARAAAVLLTAREKGIEAVIAADMALARALLGATGNKVALAFLNTAAQLLNEAPLLARAMYAEPELNTAAMNAVLWALQSDHDQASTTLAVEQALAEVDAATVHRFRQLLLGDAATPPREEA